MCRNPHNSSNWYPSNTVQLGYKHASCQNVTSTKKNSFSLYFCKNITCLSWSVKNLSSFFLAPVKFYVGGLCSNRSLMNDVHICRLHLHQLTRSLHAGFFVDTLCLYAEVLPLRSLLCVAGSVVVWSNQCSVFYSRCIFWFVLLDQPDVGCGSIKLRRRGRDYAGSKCRKQLIST